MCNIICMLNPNNAHTKEHFKKLNFNKIYNINLFMNGFIFTRQIFFFFFPPHFSALLFSNKRMCHSRQLLSNSVLSGSWAVYWVKESFKKNEIAFKFISSGYKIFTFKYLEKLNLVKNFIWNFQKIKINFCFKIFLIFYLEFQKDC